MQEKAPLCSIYLPITVSEAKPNIRMESLSRSDV